jgi:hypothetical protein
MSDPKRLLESGGDATRLERELLAGELSAAPSWKLEASVWERVVGALPPIGGPGDGGGDSTGGGDWGATAGGATAAGGASTAGASGALIGAAKASGLGVVKALAVGIFAGTVAVTGAAELGERLAAPVASSDVRVENGAEPAIPAPVPQVRSAPAVAATVPAAPPAAKRGFPRSDETPAPTPATGAASARFELPASADLASRMRAERLALDRARRALRAGDPLTALGIADGASPTGVLTQEREVLAIEALSAAGRSDAASARARGFLSRFPGSPHQNHVSKFAR